MKLQGFLATIALLAGLGCSQRAMATMLYPIEQPRETITGHFQQEETFRHKLLSSPFLDINVETREHLVGIGEWFSNGDAEPAKSDSIRERIHTTLLSAIGDVTPLVEFDFSDSGLQSIDESSVINLPPVEGSLVLKATFGDGPVEFREIEINLSTSGDGNKPVTLMTSRTGTTVYFIHFHEIHAGDSTLLIQFASPDIPGDESWARITGHAWATFPIHSPRGGNLALQLVDENGDNTPALLRITNRETGRFFEPPNSIDITEIMTSITNLPIYGPGRAYTHYIPGEYRGPFWIVPGGFEALLPPGTWTIEAYKGYEYTPVRDEVQIHEGEWTRKTITLDRWVDMADRGWFSGDDHVHARLVSSEDAHRILTWSEAVGVRVTNVLQMGDPSRTWYEQRGFGPDYRVRRGDFHLVPGQEDPRAQFGHFIALNIGNLVRDRSKYLLNDWLMEAIHNEGGLYGMTHVGEGWLGVEYDIAMSAPFEMVDFASIMQNVLGTTLYHEILDLGVKLTASAGSDTPYGGSIGITRLYVKNTWGDDFDIDEWFEGIRRGNTFVTNGPMLDLLVDGMHPPGDVVPVDGKETIQARAEVLGRPHGSAPRRVALLYNGKVLHEEWNNDPARGMIEVNLEFDPGHGGWLAIHADGFDGSQAHTTPVYLEREGFRHWNHERAPGIIRIMTDRLDQIEMMIADQVGRHERGEMAPTDYWNRFLVQQREGVLHRVNLAREKYDELLETWEREGAVRDNSQ